jgi:hypothetical protein
MKTIYTVLVYLVISSSCFAVETPCFNKPNFHLFYGNGVNNSKRSADRSLDTLSSQYLKNKESIVRYDNLYNVIKEENSLEVLSQIVQGLKQEYSENYNNTKIGTVPSYQDYIREYLPLRLIQKGVSSNLSVNKISNDHLAQMKESIKLGLNPIVVSHSQGNLYANTVCRELKADSDPIIQEFIKLNPNYNIQVASPAQEVSCGKHFTTFMDDLVIAPLQAALFATGITGNNKFLGVTPLLMGALTYEPLGHNFVKVYMGDEKSRKMIISNIEEAMDDARVLSNPKPLIKISYIDDSHSIIHKIKQPFLILAKYVKSGSQKVSQAYLRGTSYSKVASLFFQIKTLSFNASSLNKLSSYSLDFTSNDELEDFAEVFIDKIVSYRKKSYVSQFANKNPNLLKLLTQYEAYQKIRDGTETGTEINNDIKFGLTINNSRGPASDEVTLDKSIMCNDVELKGNKPEKFNVKLNYGYDLLNPVYYSVVASNYNDKNSVTKSEKSPLYKTPLDLGQKQKNILAVSIQEGTRTVQYQGSDVTIHEYQAQTTELTDAAPTTTDKVIDLELYKQCNTIKAILSNICYQGVKGLIIKRIQGLSSNN